MKNYKENTMAQHYSVLGKLVPKEVYDKHFGLTKTVDSAKTTVVKVAKEQPKAVSKVKAKAKKS